MPEETAVLRTKSSPIEKIDAEVAAFLKELGETLKGQKDPAGVGLSAVQVGRPIRVFAMLLPEQGNNEQKTMSNEEKAKSKKQKAKIVFYVNPEIVGHAKEMTLGEELSKGPRVKGQGLKENHQPFLEGCLLIPRIYGEVLRYPWIKASAAVFSETDLGSPLALSPHPLALTLDGLAARVFQHEVDHLNGILFTDHVLAQGNQLYRETGRELVEMAM